MGTNTPVLIPKPPDHVAFIDYWFAHLPAGALASDGVQIFARGLDAIWMRSCSILGEVTLRAVLERVFYSVSEIYPWLRGAVVGSAGIDLAPVRVVGLPPVQVQAGLRQCLIDILVVLGKLTSEILSEHIYAGLLGVLTDFQSGAK